MTALMSLAARLRLARLYLCTDTRRRQGDLSEFLVAALAGGVDIVQIQEPKLSREAELAALEVARAAAEPHQGIVCVRDSSRLAEAFRADLLHLGQGEGPARKARRRLHRWALIGRSTSTPVERDRALADDDIDYLWVGPVYPTPTKTNQAAMGLDLVSYAARVAPPGDLDSKPWFAVGGIDVDTLDDVLSAGARRVCVGRAIAEAADPEAAARTLGDRLRAAWRSDPAMERYAFTAVSAPPPEH